jgi:hypothetical protein
MYQVNIVIQWQDGHYEEIRGTGPDWKAARDTAVEIGNAMAIVKLQGFRVLTEKEWRALPKPVSCNNWVPKKPIPPPSAEPSKEEKPRLAKSSLANWGNRRA